MGMVLLGASLWGGSSNSIEYLMTHQHFGPEFVLLCRMVSTSLVFLLYCACKHMDLLALFRQDSRLMAKFTVLGMYVMQVPFVRAVYYSNAATATVLQYTMPAMLLGMVLLQQRRLPSRREVLAVGLAIIGTALIATKGKGTNLAVSPESLGWGLLSAFGMACYTIYASELLKKYSCFLVLGWGSLLNSLLLVVINRPSPAGIILNSSTVEAFMIMFVLGTLVAYSVYLESTQYIPASETGTLAAFEPLSAYFFSIVFMGNHVGLAEMLGALCIMTMVVVLARKG